MFFSGFCLENEKELFSEYLEENDFTISAFSYGCVKLIKAFQNGEFEDKRVDKIQFFSPSFFNDKDKKYVRLQMMFFKKDSNEYSNNFLKNCGFEDSQKKNYFKLGTGKELQELLEYKWDEKLLENIISKGIKIEVFLGGDDKIIDSQKALEFFKPLCEVYFIKDKQHIL